MPKNFYLIEVHRVYFKIGNIFFVKNKVKIEFFISNFFFGVIPRDFIFFFLINNSKKNNDSKHSNNNK